MDKNKYLTEVTNRLTSLFNASKAGYKLPNIERHRLEGFIQAGVFLNITTQPEMSDLMESIHITVFGKTPAERKAQKSASWPDISIDYDQFESPTFSR